MCCLKAGEGFEFRGLKNCLSFLFTFFGEGGGGNTKMLYRDCKGNMIASDPMDLQLRTRRLEIGVSEHRGEPFFAGP